jgi:phospho-N-acetylmuramoyl-pentapeptide-transferase
MVRALVIGSAAALVATLAGGPLIAWLRSRGFTKAISDEGPQSHQVKAGTPTMGGLLVLGTVLVFTATTLLAGRPFLLLPLGVMAGAAVVGLADDMLTIQGRERIGGHERGGLIAKALLGGVLGLIAGLVVYYSLDREYVSVPHFGTYHWSAAALVLASVAVVGGTTSAVAITDGLDGLVGGLLLFAYGAYGVIAGLEGETYLMMFCFTVVGALAGFLWHNAHPASVFMGETGVLPLGAGLAVVALMTGWWLVLPVIGVVFVAEALSDVVQISSFQLSGRRVLRMAPLHHHFELLGWKETQVVSRFWLVGIAGALLGVALVATNLPPGPSSSLWVGISLVLTQ